MRHFNKEYFEVHCQSAKAYDARIQPKPFPGRYPTRIAYRIYRKDGVPIRYCGKPNVEAIKKFHTAIRSRGCNGYWAVEFDKKHEVWRTYGTRPFNQPPGQNVAPQYICRSLSVAYHWWNGHSRMFLAFLAPFWVKRISGKIPTYVPWDVMPENEQRNVTAYKEQLAAHFIA